MNRTVGLIAIAGITIVFVLVPLLGTLFGAFGYFLVNVHSDEVGIKFDMNQPIEVVGPGVYNDWGPGNLFRYKGITMINVSALPFQASDPEVLTKDRQRIGIVVTGTVTRPGAANPQTLLDLWSSYRRFYQSDKDINEAGKGLMQYLSGQAMKVCVGERTFDNAIVGNARDDLRQCIEQELDKLAGGYGLNTANIVIPDVPISTEVQGQLDAITKARLDTQIAQQAQLQAVAEADRNAATQRGAIVAEQAKIQEKATQDARTAELQTAALVAQQQSIDASKNNELLTAQRDREIAAVQREAATLQAQASVAPEQAKAEMLQRNGNYSELLEAQTMAGAYKNTDKVIMIPQGTNPIAILGDSGKVIVNDSQR